MIEREADGLCAAGQSTIIEIKSLHYNELFDFSPGIEHLVHSGFGLRYLRVGEPRDGSPARQEVVYPSRLLTLSSISAVTLRL